MKRLLASTVAAVFLSAASAQAAPPVLQSAGLIAGVLSATWTLPPGMTTDFIEVASGPETYPEGDFLISNSVLYDNTLEDDQTSYTTSTPLRPGTYYIHVAAVDASKCLTGVEPECLIDEFSNVLTITIPEGSNDNGSGKSGSDKTTSFASLSVLSKQDIDKLVVIASMKEAGTLSAGGTVRAGRKVYKLKTASGNATPGSKVRLRPKLSGKALKAVKRALRRHKKVRAELTATARDKAGNVKTEKRTVALKDDSRAVTPRSPSAYRPPRA